MAFPFLSVTTTSTLMTLTSMFSTSLGISAAGCCLPGCCCAASVVAASMRARIRFTCISDGVDDRSECSVTCENRRALQTHAPGENSDEGFQPSASDETRSADVRQDG